MHECYVFGPLPYRDLSIQIIPKLGPKVCKHYLYWVIGSLRLGVERCKRTLGSFGKAPPWYLLRRLGVSGLGCPKLQSCFGFRV